MFWYGYPMPEPPSMPVPPIDRSLALACRIHTFRNRWLEVRCCRGTTYVPLRLVGASHPGLALADLVVRLRCRICGDKPHSVALIENPAGNSPGGPPPGWRLPLLGSDA